MKSRTQILLGGALLLAVLVGSSLKSVTRSAATSRSGGACCPALPGMSALPGFVAPNETNGNRATNLSSAAKPE